VREDDVVSVFAVVVAPVLEQAERARRARVEIGKRRRMDSFQVRDFVARNALMTHQCPSQLEAITS
jgi:hypothetical protein